MRGLSAAELMDVWERGWDRGPVEQALGLLAAAIPQSSHGDLAALTAGQRDALLLRLRASTFGNRVTTLAACPDCQQPSELAFSVMDLLGQQSTEPPADAETSPWQSVTVDGWNVRFRLPNSHDLLAIANAENVPAARQLLLERCVAAATHRGEPMAPDRLPADVVQLISDRMEQADPQADIRLALVCPSCRCRWQATFDIVSYLWKEIDGWARRTLYDVHLLATAYGWREADILAMSPWRRRHYLDLVGR